MDISSEQTNETLAKELHRADQLFDKFRRRECARHHVRMSHLQKLHLNARASAFDKANFSDAEIAVYIDVYNDCPSPSEAHSAGPAILSTAEF
ncbi:MAG: hypothetical protein EOO79_09395 [Oxalobacteraceae bacterium]|nr:MAG: hypothetical protein EOO79_09395 [Oxalobacteraceae bacterium]